MEFKYYQCSGGKAVPKNPYDQFVPSKSCINVNWQEFNVFAKENTVSCSEDLSGEYKVEDFNKPIWQFLNVKFEWSNCYQNDPSFSKQHGFSTRQYIELKPVEKQTNKTINEYIMVNSFHCECPKCGEKYDVMPADGTAINKNKNNFKQLEVKQQGGEWISVKDRLPKDQFSVLVWGCYTADCPHRAMEARYRIKGNNIEFRSFDGIKTKNVTHWMPLPSPPKSI